MVKSSFCRAFRIVDEQVACDRDPRFTLEVVDDAVPLVFVNGADTLAPTSRELLGIEGGDRILLVGGGVASGISSIDMTREIEERTLLAVASRIRDAIADGYRPSVSYAVPEQRAIFDRIFVDFPHEVREIDTSFHLDMHGDDFNQWLMSQPSKVRGTWYRDMRKSDQMNLTYQVESIDDSNVRPIAELIAVNERLNGMPGNVRLTEWRLRKDLSTVGSMSAFCGYAAGGELVSTLVVRTIDSFQELRYVGMGEAVENRRDVYHDVAFLAPVRAAFQAGVTRIEYGRTHALPKKVRGCEAVQLVRYAIQEGSHANA